MGYNLIIGEAEFDVDRVGDDEWTEDIQDEYIQVTAGHVRHDDAPAFGEPTDYTNQRWPSYTQWYDFCEKADLVHVFYVIDEHGNNTGTLRGGHPGYFPITPTVKAEVDKVYDRVKMQAKTLDPGADIFSTDVGAVWVRVQWLKYWIDWALENCKVPVFVNT